MSVVHTTSVFKRGQSVLKMRFDTSGIEAWSMAITSFQSTYKNMMCAGNCALRLRTVCHSKYLYMFSRCVVVGLSVAATNSKQPCSLS